METELTDQQEAKEMDKPNHASIEFAVRWQSACASHTDRCFFDKVNFWRDVFPRDLGERLRVARQGETLSAQFPSGELVPPRERARVHRVRPWQMRRKLRSGGEIEPRPGRFYPRGIVEGVSDSYPEDRRPFRFLGTEGSDFLVDFNHPLAQFPLNLQAWLVEFRDDREEHGGRCNDIPRDVADNGPGMQAARDGYETDFRAGKPFERAEEGDDARFYGQARLVNHVDSVAMAGIREIYGRFVKANARVLDLMSSWNSHLPEGVEDLKVTGLGLNREELAFNARLSDYLVHDLNRDPLLPFAPDSFDAAICTVSVEYLTDAVAVFREVGRVLRSGAPFVVTFSERWFPPKVVRIWTELHPFERMALVLDYFCEAGSFTDLGTESMRGRLRPEDDKYIRLTPWADPVYAVWGRSH
jgi:SAM-dependent methyltransferase